MTFIAGECDDAAFGEVVKLGDAVTDGASMSTGDVVATIGPSDARILARAARASGKLGGVTGVLAGVHTYKQKTN